MALILVHTFFHETDTRVEVYWDDVALAVSCQAFDVATNAAVSPPFASTEGDIGYVEGDTMYFYCSGTTLIRILSTTFYPFGIYSPEANSEACGYSPSNPDPDPIGTICFAESAVVDKTDETLQGLHNGTITANVSFVGGGVVEYSLDGINWQTSVSFTGLFPGTYLLRARKQGDISCTYSEAIIIEAAPAVAVIDYPWQEKLCFFFKLIRGGVEYPIREPIKWDQVNIVGKRDKDWHGWLYQYSDGIIELEFDCPAGKEVIDAEYDEKGSDGEVFFTYGYTYKGVDYQLYNGKLNLNTLKRFPGKVSASLERSDFNQLFTSRIDTKVKMNQAMSVDDVAVIAPAPYETQLHAKEIVRTFTQQYTSPIEGFSVFKVKESGAPKNAYIFPSTENATREEITQFFSKNLDISNLEPWLYDNYTWLLDFDGVYNFNAGFTLRGAFNINSLASPLNATFYLFLRINDTEELLGPAQSLVITDNVPFTINFGGLRTGLNLKKGDKVYFYIRMDSTISSIFSNIEVSTTIYQENTNIVFDSLEQAPSSFAKGWFIHDAIDHCIKVITNNQSELRSRLLSRQSYLFPADGEGSLNLTTNGKQIRRFNIADNPLVISLKDLLASVQALYCVGFGFEKSGEKEIVRVERVGYFYQNRQIIVIPECWDYREEVAKELLFNEVETGYEKYQDEGYNTLDEFNTKHEYITPIKTNKAKLTQKSKLIASGWKIEDVRRQQFEQTSKDSYSNDEDGFIVSMRRTGLDSYVPEKDEAFQAVANLISPQTAYNLRLSPKRMLVNWAEWLRNCFHYKPGTDKIKNTFVAQNGKLTTQLLATDARPVGDINKLEWVENGDVVLSDYLVGERIFRPEWISFKCRLTPDKVALINDALMGRSLDSVNYGYVTVKDKDGNYQAGFPYEMEYNFYTEQCTIKMLKKHDSPVDPEAECCYPLYANGCELLVNNETIIT